MYMLHPGRSIYICSPLPECTPNARKSIPTHPKNTILQDTDDEDDEENSESEEGSQADPDPEVCPKEVEERAESSSSRNTPKSDKVESPNPVGDQPTGSKEGDAKEKGTEEVKAAVAPTSVVSTETKDDVEPKGKENGDGESSTFVCICLGVFKHVLAPW